MRWRNPQQAMRLVVSMAIAAGSGAEMQRPLFVPPALNVLFRREVRIP